MKNFLKNKVVLGSAALAAVAMSGTANAAIDVSSIVTELSSNSTSISQVGGAGLLLFSAAIVFRYIKKAF